MSYHGEFELQPKREANSHRTCAQGAKQLCLDDVLEQVHSALLLTVQCDIDLWCSVCTVGTTS